MPDSPLSRFVPIVFLLISVLVGTGCGDHRMRKGVPTSQASTALVPGYPATIRTWGDDVSVEFQTSCFSSAVVTRDAYIQAHPEEGRPTIDLMCISGGGEAGAYGAGLLNGWTATGKRPEFLIVTGISTGALSAPMAFVGAPYDQRLKDAYTQVTKNDIMSMRSIFSWLHADSISDNTALRKLISKYIDQELVDRVAIEHAKGRRLLVATTNLDAQRPVIWDMGAIASSGRSDRLELFRDVLQASASIPAVFPPVYLPVDIGGKTMEEMHVDGGATMQVFLFGSGIDVNSFRGSREITTKPVRCFIIRNDKFGPEHQEVKASLGSIAGRSISTLIKSNGKGDVLRIYSYCQSLKMDYNLTAIPDSFDVPLREPFDRDYMNALYKVGYAEGLKGGNWSKQPPFGILKNLEPASTQPAPAAIVR
jgi:Patatin-like phospholipase